MNITLKYYNHFPLNTPCFLLVQQLRPHLTTSESVQKAMGGMEKEHCVFWIAYDENEKALGYISYRKVCNSYLGDFVLVDDMVVLESHRGIGIGTLLMKEVETKCRKEGISTLKLDSGLQRSQTHLFYEKQGFEKKCYTFEKRLL